MLRRRMARPTREAQEASVYFNAMTNSFYSTAEGDSVVIKVNPAVARLWSTKLKWQDGP